jgi:hypothetical protein
VVAHRGDSPETPHTARHASRDTTLLRIASSAYNWFVDYALGVKVRCQLPTAKVLLTFLLLVQFRQTIEENTDRP